MEKLTRSTLKNHLKKPLKISDLCPCDSHKTYGFCCRKFIEEGLIPERPEQLMRSRYTAYTQGDVSYIQKTMIGKALEDFNLEETREWALAVKWKKLKVLKTGTMLKPGLEPGLESALKRAFVEFVAVYQQAGVFQELHEKSEFVQQDGRWFYSGSL